MAASRTPQRSPSRSLVRRARAAIAGAFNTSARPAGSVKTTPTRPARRPGQPAKAGRRCVRVERGFPTPGLPSSPLACSGRPDPDASSDLRIEERELVFASLNRGITSGVDLRPNVDGPDLSRTLSESGDDYEPPRLGSKVKSQCGDSWRVGGRVSERRKHVHGGLPSPSLGRAVTRDLAHGSFLGAWVERRCLRRKLSVGCQYLPTKKRTGCRATCGSRSGSETSMHWTDLVRR